MQRFSKDWPNLVALGLSVVWNAHTGLPVLRGWNQLSFVKLQCSTAIATKQDPSALLYWLITRHPH